MLYKRTKIGKGGQFAAKIGPAGPILAAKVVRGTTEFSAKIDPAGPILRGTDFCMTGVTN